MDNDKAANAAMTKALIKVQQHVLKASRDRANPVFGSKYATLESILDAVREPLAEHGFALVQEATTTGGGNNDPTSAEPLFVSVTTRLLHDSGGELASKPLFAPLKKEFTKTGVELPPSVQQIGSVVTYLRRYSLCPFLGVAAEDDDDGNAASHIGKDAPAPAAKTTAPTGKPAAANAAPAAAHRSVHTGELLDSPEAVARHKAAAEKARPADDRQPGTKPAAASAAACAPVANARLAAAMEADRITPEGLTGYLKGELGKPRISNPMLTGSMTVDSLGEPIVNAMLKPANWGLIVSRIKADHEYVPF